MKDPLINFSVVQGTPASFTRRKQSHDVRNRNNKSFSMGTGLQGMGPLLNELISPRHSLIEPSAHLDMARMNNTASGVGGFSTNTTMLRKNQHNLTVTNVVDIVLRKPAFGFEGYNPKAVVKDLLPVNTHVRAKAKRRMFCEEAIKAKDKVPAADKY